MIYAKLIFGRYKYAIKEQRHEGAALLDNIQEFSDQSAACSLRRRIISIADFGIRVPGPKIAETPAL